MVCLTVTFVHCAQMLKFVVLKSEDIDTISFAYEKLVYSGQPLPANFCPKVTPMIWALATFNGKLRLLNGYRDSTMVIMETNIALSNGTIADPTTSPSPKWVFLCKRPTSPFAKLLWPLLPLFKKISLVTIRYCWLLRCYCHQYTHIVGRVITDGQ